MASLGKKQGRKRRAPGLCSMDDRGARGTVWKGLLLAPTGLWCTLHTCCLPPDPEDLYITSETSGGRPEFPTGSEPCLPAHDSSASHPRPYSRMGMVYPGQPGPWFCCACTHLYDIPAHIHSHWSWELPSAGRSDLPLALHPSAPCTGDADRAKGRVVL